jgi:hypothetical protein
MKWGLSRKDYLSIKNTLDLEQKGKIKLCNKCKKSLETCLKKLQSSPFKICQFCDSIITVDAIVCSKCQKAQV